MPYFYIITAMAGPLFEKPIGLFLTGGGALGSWQAGCLDRLVTGYGVEFDVVAGFSAGALNGMAYCLGRTSEIERMWKSLKPGSLLKLSPRLMPFTLFSDKPLKSLLEKWMGTQEMVFKFPATAFYVICHCVETRLPYFAEFTSGRKNKDITLLDALLASCAMPVIFPPVRVKTAGGTRTLTDGGVLGKSPMNLDIFKNCRTVVAISISRPQDMNLPVRGLPSYFESRARKILCVHVQKALESLKNLSSPPCLHHIRPKADTGLRILDFNGARCARAYATGSQAMDALIHSITSGRNRP